ncbi:MAG: hypothetical protein J6K32_12960 [Clostridia bacterium]|nr:hypothetical protein [Clostridia bacterium]
MLLKIMEKIYDSLDEIEVKGHDNVKRMAAVMDAVNDVIVIIKKTEEAGGMDDESHNKQGA